MSKRRPHNKNRGRRHGGGGRTGGGGASAIKLRAVPSDGWEFIAPACAKERAEDLEEVRAMIEAGETEIATDELRYLLSGCPDLMEAHLLLGQLAIHAEPAPESDVELARGHFGYAFAIGEKALKAARCDGPILGKQPANAPWHEAARGLAWCFEKQGNPAMADRIAATVKRLDPSDPAEVAAMLDELRAGGLPIVELG